VHNLFVELAREGKVREDFATAALGCLIDRDRGVRSTFLDACRRNLSGSLSGTSEPAARRVLEELRSTDRVEITFQPGIRGGGAGFAAVVSKRVRYPDLRIVAPAVRCCLLVEVKVDSPATHHLADGLPGGEPEVTDAQPPYVIQTQSYKDWLDRHYGDRGVLFALTVSPDDDLAYPCHGSLTWTDVRDALRITQTRESFLSNEFCGYLERSNMATRTVGPLEAQDIALMDTVATCRWARWEELSHAVANHILTLLRNEPPVTSVKPVRRWELRVWRSADPAHENRGERGFWFWTDELSGQVGRSKFWLLPFLIYDRGAWVFACELDFGKVALDDLRSVLQPIEIEHPPTTGPIAFTELPDTTFSTGQDAARVVADAGMKAIVRPLIRMLAENDQ
jgi:hypothetical protein